MEKEEFKDIKKSPWNFELCDSGWEKEEMEKLEKDENVKKWTKNHGLRIPYRNDIGKVSYYLPDFLVEFKDGSKEIREIKGAHLLKAKDTAKKIDSAREWCRVRGMSYKVISRY